MPNSQLTITDCSNWNITAGREEDSWRIERTRTDPERKSTSRKAARACVDTEPSAADSRRLWTVAADQWSVFGHSRTDVWTGFVAAAIVAVETMADEKLFEPVSAADNDDRTSVATVTDPPSMAGRSSPVMSARNCLHPSPDYHSICPIVDSFRASARSHHKARGVARTRHRQSRTFGRSFAAVADVVAAAADHRGVVGQVGHGHRPLESSVLDDQSDGHSVRFSSSVEHCSAMGAWH